MKKIINYFGSQKAKIGCDEKCNKAWGSNTRPRIYCDIGEDVIFGLGKDDSIYPENNGYTKEYDTDDYAYLSDDELGEAPINPMTSEGGHWKPTRKENIPNKWCIRECERCAMSKPDEYDKPLKLKDFSKRRYNFHSKNID